MSAPRNLVEFGRKVFGNAMRVTGERSGRKLLMSSLKGPAVMSWYGPQLVKDERFVDPDHVTRKVKLDRLKRRGKGPPKKGQGKRASKKK